MGICALHINCRAYLYLVILVSASTSLGNNSLLHQHVCYLFIGTKVYSTIKAVDGAGLMSTAVKSDGVMVDTTPPLSASAIKYGANIINLQSEIDLDSTKNTDMKKTFTTTPGKKYRLTVYTRPSQNKKSVSNSHINIELPSHNQIMLVHGSTDPKINSLWTKHQLYFVAIKGTSNLRISPHGKHSSVQVNKITVQEMSTTYVGNTVGADAIHAYVQTHNNISSVIATWMFQDPEVPITKYIWAIGYVAGKYSIVSL